MTVQENADRAFPPQVSGRDRPAVGLLTFHFVRNFGGVWQAFGLARTVSELGSVPSFVDYQPAHVENGAPFQFGLGRESAIANITAAYQRTQKFRSRLFGEKSQAEEFDSFRRNYLPTGGVRYTSIDQLRANPPTLDAFIVGSDQIWHRSRQFGFDPVYFLDFPTGDAKRYSYAASFGRSVAYEDEVEILRSRLHAFDELSIREESGTSYAKQVCGRDAYRHCDPSLLQGETISAMAMHCDLTRFKLPKRHVAVYAVRSENAVAESCREVAGIMNASIVRMRSSRVSPRRTSGNVYPGPLEWAGIIAQSQAVVTNSFHGTIFSILCRRPFVCLSIGGKKTQMDDRVRNLLDQCGLQDRFCTDSNEASQKIKNLVDWQSVSERLVEMRGDAIDYLSKLLLQVSESKRVHSGLEQSNGNANV